MTCGHDSVWSVLSLSLLLGLTEALIQPASQGLVGRLVASVDRPAAIALNSIGFNLARFVGPLVGGVLVHSSLYSTAYALNSVSYIPVSLVLLAVDLVPTGSSGGQPKGMFGSLIDGVRYALGSSDIRSSLITLAAISVLVRPSVELMAGFADRVYGGDGLLYGLFLASNGSGAIVAGIWLTRRRDRNYYPAIQRASLISGASLAMIGLAPYWLAGAVSFFALGVALFVNGIGTMTHIQQTADQNLVGRVLGLYFLMFRLCLLLGVGFYSAVASAVGLRSVALICSVACGALYVVINRAHVRQGRPSPKTRGS